jgi:hypothetical protein
LAARRRRTASIGNAQQGIRLRDECIGDPGEVVMKGRWHMLAGALFLAALLFNLFAWGGLARSSSMGPIVADAASRELSLAGVYIPFGRVAIDLLGLSGFATAYATDAFAPLQPALLRNPQAAMETLIRDMPGGVRIAYYGAPVMLLAFVIAWWRRPRVLQTIRRR